VDDILNPRKVPGILSRPGESGAEVFPFHSDYDHPSIFWITNTWNDFRYNVAVGAGTCGACYWMPPSQNSGPSLYETWDSYASMQTTGRGGATPTLNFVGNSCSTAMNALETVSNTSPCFGVVAADAPSDSTNLHAIANPNPLPDNSYPQVNGDLRQHATLCDDAHQNDCSKVNLCSGVGADEALCEPTVIDQLHHFIQLVAEKLRGCLAAGLVVPIARQCGHRCPKRRPHLCHGRRVHPGRRGAGFWNLSQRVLFVGNTQPIDTGTKVPRIQPHPTRAPSIPVG